MPIDRRSMIKAIGAALCAGAVPKFVAELIPTGMEGFERIINTTMPYSQWVPTTINASPVLTIEMIQKCVDDLKKNTGRHSELYRYT